MPIHGEGEHGRPEHEGELSEAGDARSEEADLEELAESAREVAARIDAEFHVAMEAINDSIRQLDSLTFHSEALEAAQSEPVQSANVGIEDPASLDPRLEAIETSLKKLLRNVEKEPAAKKESSAKKWLARSLGLSALAAGLAAMIYEVCVRSARGQPTNDLTAVPEETRARLRALVAKWQKMPDADFWEQVATYVGSQKPAPTVADQIIFLNYTAQMCPAQDPWLWPTATEEMKVVDAISRDYVPGDPCGAAVLYRAVARERFQNQAIPREVAASVLQIALAQIFRVDLAT